MKNIAPTAKRCALQLITGILMAALLLGFAACSTTHQVRGTVEESGFLKDYSRLQKGKEGQAKLVYVDSTAAWSQYSKVYIRPVEFWHSNDPESKLGKLTTEEQQVLVQYAQASLRNALSEKFQVVNQTGPGVLVVHCAITEAKKSRPVLNLASSIIPAGRALSLLQRGISGTGMGVGECQAEMELLDGATGRRVGAAVDRRAGTKALRTKFDTSLGDIKLALDYWSERLADRLVELRAGKTGTTSLP